MKILTKYYGNTRLEIYTVGALYKFVVRSKFDEIQPIYKPSTYEFSVPICFNKVEQWFKSHGDSSDAI